MRSHPLLDAEPPLLVNASDLRGTPPACPPTHLLLRLEHRSGCLWPLGAALPCANLHLGPFTGDTLTCCLLVHPPPQILIKKSASTFTQAGCKVVSVNMAKEMNLSLLGFMILKALVLFGRLEARLAAAGAGLRQGQVRLLPPLPRRRSRPQPSAFARALRRRESGR